MISFAENIFKFPRIYEFKIKILNHLNNLDSFSVEHIIKNKKILDIGCGSLQFYYDPKNTSSRTAIDASPEMIEASRALYPHSNYQIASAEKLPFFEKSFNVVTFFFVLHHIDAKKWELVLAEAKRVTTDEVLILDHTQNDNFFLAFIQRVYWHFFDGGKIYRKEYEWDHLLSGFKIKEYKRTGLLFKNICYYRLSIN